MVRYIFSLTMEKPWTYKHSNTVKGGDDSYDLSQEAEPTFTPSTKVKQDDTKQVT